MSRRQFVDEDAEFDQTAAGASLLAGPEKNLHAPSGGPEGAPGTSGRLGRSQARTAISKGRTPRPDSATGLALHFLDACPQRSWSTGLEFSNFRAVIAIFSELLRLDVEPEACRAMVTLYFTQLNGRVPDKAYCWDFKWKRHQLLRQLTQTGVTTTTDDYRDWLAPQPVEDNQDFAASWSQR